LQVPKPNIPHRKFESDLINFLIDTEYNLGAQQTCNLKFILFVQSFRLETFALKLKVSRLGILSLNGKKSKVFRLENLSHLGLISSRLGSDCVFAFRFERVKGSRLGKAFTRSSLHSTDLLF